MNRKETTKLLTDILIHDRLSDRKYYAKEVTLDYGTDHPKRVDVMQFIPAGVVYASDIEKGTFVCYEVKSCKEDVYSGNGLRFYGEKNYVVATMQTYKDMLDDLRGGKFYSYLYQNYPESSNHIGWMVPLPKGCDLRNTDQIHHYFENPPEFKGNAFDWQMFTIMPCHEGRRTRSMTELLFCMLRSKHNDTNRM